MRSLALANGRALPLDRVSLLGVINVTPDSFSDGGLHLHPERAVERAHELVSQGAHALDLGAESTRPGADPTDPAEQIARLAPVVRALRRERAFDGVPLSIDTRSARVFAACVDEGADLLNDVSGLEYDPDMPRVVARAGCAAIAMHSKGIPATMQASPTYQDVLAEVGAYLAMRVCALCDAGVDPAKVLLDPGIGFGKTLDHNLALLARLGGLLPREALPLTLRSAPLPWVVGVSRKSMLRALGAHETPSERVVESVAAAMAAVERGAKVLRVHDVAEHARALRVVEAVRSVRS